MTARDAINSLMGERGRLRSSHEMLAVAIEASERNAEFAPFYVAVADFIEASMERLDKQDLFMLDRLAEKLDGGTDEELAIMDEVHRRLDGNRALLTRFTGCRARLADHPDDSAIREEFESLSREYIEYIHQNMGHHAPSTDLARREFDDADWENMALLDDAYFERERHLYKRVLDTRPAVVPRNLTAEGYP